MVLYTYIYHYHFFLQKSLTIFHAALYGGAVITTGLDYFVEHSVMLMWVWDRVRVKESKPICWFSWAIVATWPLTFLLGKFLLFFNLASESILKLKGNAKGQLISKGHFILLIGGFYFDSLTLLF